MSCKDKTPKDAVFNAIHPIFDTVFVATEKRHFHPSSYAGLEPELGLPTPIKMQQVDVTIRLAQWRKPCS